MNTVTCNTLIHRSSPFSKHIDVYVIQIYIMNNHMNGKDTHVRGVKVLGPLE